MVKKLIIIISLIFIAGCKIEGSGGSGGLLSQYDEETIAQYLSTYGNSNMTIDELLANVSLSDISSYINLTDTGYYDTGSQNPGFAPVPEPATFSLLGLGLAGLLFTRRKAK